MNRRPEANGFRASGKSTVNTNSDTWTEGAHDEQEVIDIRIAIAIGVAASTCPKRSDGREEVVHIHFATAVKITYASVVIFAIGCCK